MTANDPTAETPVDDAETYFGLLADPTRIRVLAALARAEAAGETPLPYSDLQSRAGVRDNGRLNYHLSRLDGRFLSRADGAYALRPAGRFAHLVAVRATREGSDDPVETDADCPACGTRLVARQAGETFAVACGDCGLIAVRADGPFVRPSAVDRQTFLDALDRTVRERAGFLARGLCPWCRSGTETRVSADEDVGGDVDDEDVAHGPDGEDVAHGPDGEDVAHGPDGEDVAHGPDASPDADARGGVHFLHRCDSCAGVHRTAPGELLLDHPAVVAFHRRHGVELGGRRAWTLPFVADGDVAVRARDPWRVAVTLSLDGSDLTCVLDGEGAVLDTSTRTYLRGV